MTAAPPDNDRALDEAIDWMIRLAEAPADTVLQAQCERWRAASSENEAAWAHAARVSGLLAQTRHIAAFPTLPAVPAPRSRRRRRLYAGIGAAVAASIVLALAAPSLKVRLEADYQTATAVRRTIHLADGSVVTLAPQSAIRVAFSPGERRITLLSGEAYFAVTHDAARPFEVFAGPIETTDIGTAFDVALAPGGGEVSVREGAVRVSYGGSAPGSRDLHAGEWMAVEGGIATAGHSAPEVIGAWTTGKLAVIDRPLSEVLAELRPYYAGLILLTDRRLGEERVTGSFDLSDPVAAVRALVRPQGAEVRRITPWLLVISPS